MKISDTRNRVLQAMKKDRIGKRLGVFFASMALVIASAGAAVFEDFESYTVGDDWTTNAPAGWTIGATSPVNAGIAADPEDASNKVYWYDGGQGSDFPTNNGFAGWEWGGEHATWTGAVQASVDLYIVQVTGGRFDLRMRGENNVGQVRFNSTQTISVSSDVAAATTLADTWDADQWYRVIWDFNLPEGDTENRYFDLSIYELSAAGGTLGDQIGSTVRTDLSTEETVNLNNFYMLSNSGEDRVREFYLDNITVIPEPGSLLLLGAGALALGLHRRFRS